MDTDSNAVFLAAAEYVDSDHPAIRAAARDIAPPSLGPAERAQAIFHFVREVRYGHDSFADIETYRASSVLAAGQGYCVGKAALFAALARAAGLPCKVAFADVTNHLASPRLTAALGTDLFAWHGYNEVLVDGRWRKVCAAFDAAVCARFGVASLEFDGVSDAILQPYDGEGRAFMAYVKVHGAFHDTPARFLRAEMARLYPRVAGPGGVPPHLRRRD